MRTERERERESALLERESERVCVRDSAKEIEGERESGCERESMVNTAPVAM